MLGTSGNLSVLITGHMDVRTYEPMKDFEFLITASGKDKGELTEEDFILVDEEGQPQGIIPTKPSAETLLHAAIYKQTNAKAVFHVHTTNSALLSMYNPPIPHSPIPPLFFSGLEMLKGLGFKTHDVKVTIPVIENSQDMKYLAEIVPGYINEDIPGLLLKGHGIYAWGQSTYEAKRHVEIFEFLFEYRVKEKLINR